MEAMQNSFQNGNIKIIGLSGLAGSGKDTVGDILEEKGFTKISFADPIKRFSMEIFDFSEEQLWGPSSFRNKQDLRYPIKDINHIAYKDYTDEAKSMVLAELECKDDFYFLQHLTPRLVLQVLGTEVGRLIRKTIWVDYTLSIIKKLIENPMMGYDRVEGIQKHIYKTPRKGIVITDVRFINEVSAIKSIDSTLLKIKRDSAGLKGTPGNHSSESEMSGLGDEVFDEIINNNDSLDKLKEVLFSKI